MRILSNILMLGICNSFLRCPLAFRHVPSRQISKTAVLMRSKKK